MASSPCNGQSGATEEEEFEEGDDWEKASDRCLKKQNHDKYICIPVDDNFNDLIPEPYAGKQLVSSLLRHMSSLTGKIKVGSMYCTGFVQAIRQEIFKKDPGQISPNSHPKGVRGYILTVTTARHVLERATKESRATMELSWYHRGENLQVTVHLSRVVSTDKECNEKEWCAAEFVCHDAAKMDEMKKLEDHLKKFQTLQGELYKEYKKKREEQLVIILSHPHGGPKRISYYSTFRDRRIVTHLREDQEWCRYSYDAPTCRGCSGAPIFILGQALCGFGYWLGHPHIHIRSEALEKEVVGYSSLGCDHISRG